MPADELTMMIDPPLPASIIAGTAARMVRQVPLRLTSMTLSHCSSDISKIRPQLRMPAFATMNQPIEDMLTSLGVLYDRTVRASRAGTALRAAMAVLAKPSKQLAMTLGELNLQYEDVNPRTKRFTDILRTLHDAGMTSQQSAELMGRRYGSVFHLLTRLATPAMIKFRDTLIETIETL